MGRWTSRSSAREARDWMLPGRHVGASADRGDASDTAPGATAAGSSGSGVVVLDPPRAATWARPRAPLRRHTGVPAPEETPLFVHRAALAHLHARRRRQRRAVVIIAGATVTTSVLLRVLLGG